jgi:putative membrane protein
MKTRSNTLIPERGAGARWLPWFGLLGAPFAWVVHIGARYPLLPFLCRRGWTLPLHLISLVCGTIAVMAGLSAWRVSVRARSRRDPTVAQRERFMGLGGVFCAGVFFLAIVNEALPVFLQPPCFGIAGAEPFAMVLVHPVLLAHLTDDLSAATPFWQMWTFQPWLMLSLLLGAGMYFRGVHRVWSRAGVGHGIGRGHVSAFVLGYFTLCAALLSPLDPLGEILFSAHMVQHMLLLAVAAPLLAFSRLHWTMLWAMPDRARKAVGRFWRRSLRLRQGVEWVGSAPVAWTARAAAVWLWHLPWFYERALENNTVHAIEHASFVATGFLFWTVSVRASSRRGIGHGAAVLFVFAAAIQEGLLGALITFATSGWYRAHAQGAWAWGLTLLEDQQLAGMIMWIPGGMIYLAAALFHFAKWVGFEREGFEVGQVGCS